MFVGPGHPHASRLAQTEDGAQARVATVRWPVRFLRFVRKPESPVAVAAAEATLDAN